MVIYICQGAILLHVNMTLMNSLLTVDILDITVFNTKTFVVKLAYKHKTGDFVHLVQIVRLLGGLGKFLRYPKFTKTR